MDAHLRQFLHRVPQIREDYFNHPPPPPADKLQNPRPLPPPQEKRLCKLCSAAVSKPGNTHMRTSHYSGPDALSCDLCPCTFATQDCRKRHRSRYHPGTEPPKRNTFGIPDINQEDAGKCDVFLELLPLEEGSKSTTYRCLWAECGKLNKGITTSREHACTHLGLKPHTCPAPGCNYSSSFFGTTVRHYKNLHGGDDEPPEKMTRSSGQPGNSIN
ncbi:zinc finger protein 595 [Folsomia candida]|uniref:Zinc finger imprinted 3 n=1 Tax=Folsomia candida TaxID=158441 RepID=A0A226EKC8_FOLCA|nr:zinc finger protein 595 [Folsomia candida]XP_035706371.1 zinc finger protein 595 [Folsomia candida]OXA58155.1 Zinc finger imprinted 3 [Folsomia candida]